MTTSALDLVPIVSALICVACAVACAFLVRRGTDSELKADVNELAQMVERYAKAERRERMRRVRAGEKVGAEAPTGSQVEIPPGAEGIPLTDPALFDKAALRRQLAMRRIGG